MSHLLILTNSFDLTTDLLLAHLEGGSVFRFNLDQFARYQILVNSDGFELSDEVGRTVSSQSVCKAYWRKPFNARLEGDFTCTRYVDAEMRYAVSELVNLLWLESKLVLVEPFAERRTGKLVQLRLARAFFNVPSHEFIVNRKATSNAGVIKSLSNELVGDQVLFTTRVQTALLAAKYPWFVEDEISAVEDVTVVFVRGRIFAFALRRDFLDRSVDWRQVVSPEQQWAHHCLPAELESAIEAFMDTLRLDYGRLDLLLDGSGSYWFCEVNPNGQFAWLDLEDSHGLISCVAAEISPTTRLAPLSSKHPLASELVPFCAASIPT